jgi:transcriptional regulator with XRE-family HTH domain
MPMPRPNGRDPQSDPAAFLGFQLRRARVAAGYASQDSFAAALGFDRSTITKAETGSRPPTDEVFAAWCDACKVSDELREVLSGLLLVARRTDGPVPAWFESYLEAEGAAHTLRIWQPLILPGLLQPAEYARALFVAAGADADKADEMVAARMARQAIFDRAKPPNLSVVLDESVLHRLIGSPQVMHDALAHVAALSERPYVMVQVLPGSNGANAGLGGAINLAGGEGTPEVLLTEAVEDQTTENRSLVQKASDTFDLVRADALPRAASRAIFLEAAEQWKT